MQKPELTGGWLERLKSTLRSAEVDRAVFYAVLARGWQFAAGTLTSLLIAFVFSADMQGFYYTFASFLAMQTIAELGLHWTIVHAASHEWAHLSQDPDGQVQGDARALSRLANLLTKARRWITAVALLFTAVVLIIGIVFFRQRPADVAWLAPWVCCCVLCGQSLAISPYIAVLEGCNQMAVVNWYRLIQLVVANLFVWMGMFLGAGLWVVAIGAAVRLAVEFALVYGKFGGFWRSLKHGRGEQTIDWSKEIWPLQWRAAVQTPAQYLAFQLFTPIMFHYHGPVVAGMMGLTLSVFNVLQQGAFAWVQSRAPLFGMLIAKRQLEELRRVFYRVTVISTLVLVATIGGFLFTLVCIHAIQHPIAQHLVDRVLAPGTATVFALATLGGYIPLCLNLYLKAHKRAPLFWLFLIANLLTAAAVFIGGSSWGPLGAGLGLLAVTTVVRLPVSVLIWHHFRLRYQRDASHPTDNTQG